MKSMKTTRALCLAAVLLLVTACVTVNIYFPAAEIKKTAEQIVDEVYGIEPTPQKSADTGNETSALGIILNLLGPRAAHAQDATTVSNANIRALKNTIASNTAALKRFYEGGEVGIGKDGMLVLRSTQGLSIRDVAEARRLVAADNQAREQLYKEVGKALNSPPDRFSDLVKIFADEWRDKAPAGWYIQEDSGAWKRK